MAGRRAIAEWQRPATEQELRFVAEYLFDRDPEGAALRAGYSPAIAKEAKHTLLKEPQIQSAIQQHIIARGLRTTVTMDRVVLELARIGLADPLDVFNDDGTIKSLSEIPEDARRAIESIEVTANGGFRVKFHSKMDALKTLIPHVDHDPKKVTRTDNERMKLLMDVALKLGERKKKSLPQTVRAEAMDSRGNPISVEIVTGEEEQDVTP